MSVVQPGDDEKYVQFLQQFIAVANANLSTLGLSSDDTAAVTQSKNALNAAIADGIQMRAAASAAVTTRKQTRQNADLLIRAVQRKITAMPDVSPALLQQVGIKTRSGHVAPVTPRTPAELLALADAGGFNTLKWKAGGNPARTNYVIEARVGSAPDFTMIDSSTRLTYKHTAQTVGVEVTYRVRAQRAKQRSEWSNESVVYKATPAAPAAPAVAPPLTFLRAA